MSETQHTESVALTPMPRLTPDQIESTLASCLWWSYDKQSDLLHKTGFLQAGEAGLTEQSEAQLRLEVDVRCFERVPGQSMPGIVSPEVQAAVGLAQIPCPLCGKHTETTGGSIRLLHRGRRSGIFVALPVPCICRQYRLIYPRWMNPVHVSREHRGCTWEALMSGKLYPRLRALSMPLYANMMACLQAFPNFNTLITGKTGQGKTTLMTAFYDKALRDWARRVYMAELNHETVSGEAVWKKEANELAAEWHAFETKGKAPEGTIVPDPSVVPTQILGAMGNQNRFRPFLGLDEFDKWRCSEFKSESLWRLINPMQQNEGQVVCCSNISYSDLLAKIGDQYGLPVIRRLVDRERGMLIDLFASKIYVNRVVHQVRRDVAGYALTPLKEVIGIPGVSDVGIFAPAPGPIDWGKVFAPGTAPASIQTHGTTAAATVAKEGTEPSTAEAPKHQASGAQKAATVADKPKPAPVRHEAQPASGLRESSHKTKSIGGAVKGYKSTREL